MYTEVLPGDQSLALLIPSLTDEMAGMYYCFASYASTQQLEISVRIETYGNCIILKTILCIFCRMHINGLQIFMVVRNPFWIRLIFNNSLSEHFSNRPTNLYSKVNVVCSCYVFRMHVHEKENFKTIEHV